MSSESTHTPNYPRRPPRIIRLVRTRPRLFIAIAVGIIVAAILFLATDWRAATKLLIGWDVGVVFYLALAAALVARSDVHRLKRRAANQDEGNLAILFLVVAAAIASLGAVFAELATQAGQPRGTPSRAGPAHSGDCHGGAVMGVHPLDLRAALRTRILR